MTSMTQPSTLVKAALQFLGIKKRLHKNISEYVWRELHRQRRGDILIPFGGIHVKRGFFLLQSYLLCSQNLKPSLRSDRE